MNREGRNLSLSSSAEKKIKSADLQTSRRTREAAMLCFLPRSICPRAPMSRFLLSFFNASPEAPTLPFPKEMPYGRFRAVEAEVSACSGRDQQGGRATGELEP